MKVFVTDYDGAVHEVEAEPNWQLMEAIRDAGLPIKAECGGCCSCATCHVYVAEAWLDALPAKQADEDALLADAALEPKPNSRLSCQILMRPELDGLAVTIAPS